MKQLKLHEIINAISGDIKIQSDTFINNISIDSRAIGENTVFIAIKGENFDGHNYIDCAFENGALYVVVNKNATINVSDEYADKIIKVENTEQAFVDIAGLYRSKFNIPVVGITGSVGKTTTKEMVHCFLSTKFNTLKTEGNFNNQIGMPKTIFNIDDTTEAAVLEMGTCNPGEIRQLTLAARPDVAIITAIGVSHIENFKSRENILNGKMEIAEGLSEKGTLIINSDDDMLQGVVKGRKNILTFAIDDKNADIVANDIETSAFSQNFSIKYGENKYNVYLPCIGLHNIYNALAAFCAGVALGVDLKEGCKALGNYKPAGLRQKIEKIENVILIEDCYNASPDSMRSALNVLSSMNDNWPLIAVFADMLELGDISKQSHFDIGKYCAEKNVNYLLCYGDEAKEYINGAKSVSDKIKCLHFETKQALCDELVKVATEKSAVLFKASRSMKMEEVIDLFKEKLK